MQLFLATREARQPGKQLYKKLESSYRQGKSPRTLQNAIKTQTTLYPNAMNIMHMFYSTVEKYFYQKYLLLCLAS